MAVAFKPRSIVVTRPPGSQEPLLGQLQQLFADQLAVLHWPLLDIAPTHKTLPVEIAAADVVIVISPVAAKLALNAGLASMLSKSQLLLAVGAGSARPLQQAGLEVLYPEPAGSESLLHLAQLDRQVLRGQRVWILKGEGGRERLADSLAARDARLRQVSLYRRLPVDRSQVNAWLQQAQTDSLLPALAAITSSEALTALSDSVGTDDRRRSLHLVVSSERLMQQAQQLGWSVAGQSEDATDERLAQCLLATCQQLGVA